MAATAPRLLSIAERKALEDRLSRAVSNSTAHAIAKNNLYEPGLKYSDSESFVLIDSAVTKSELCQLLGGIIEKLCEALGVELRVFESSFELPDDAETDQFLCGLLMSLDTERIKDYLPSLRSDKKPFDLGKATGFLLRVRGEVIRGAYKHVGLQGLKTCHRFFGNDSSRPTTEQERNARKSQLEVYLMRMFAKVDGYAVRYRQYFDLLTTLFQELRLQGLEDKKVNDIINHYQKSFEDVRDQFEKPILSTKKGSKKKVQTGIRRPKKPNSSPTLLMIEFKDFVDPLITHHWSSLDHHKSDFKENVRTRGFAQVIRDIHSIYESRFEVMRNFSNLTTKRLQEARNYGILPATSKKVDFSDDVRKAFFEKRSENARVSTFVSELQKLIPERYRLDAIRRLCKGIAGVESMSPSQLIQTLSDSVAMAYARTNLSIGNYQHVNPKVDRTREKNVRECAEKLSKCITLFKGIPGRLTSFRRTAFTRKQVVMQTANYGYLKDELSQLQILVGEDFWTSTITQDVWRTFYATDLNIKDSNGFRKKIVETCQSLSGELKQAYESRDRKLFKPAVDTSAAIEEITRLMNEIKI